jgi:hypothetical protein
LTPSRAIATIDLGPAGGDILRRSIIKEEFS